MSGDPSERLLAALEELEAIADEMSSEDALDELDDATLQTFWRDWPEISSWAGRLWRTLERDLSTAATPTSNAWEEKGGSG